MRKRSTRMALVAVPALIASVVAPAAANAAPSSSLTTIPHTKPLWIANSKVSSAALSTSAVNARVYLQPNGGQAALAAFATAVSTKGNAQYHKFLSTAQYYARFGTTTSTVNAVKQYLTSSGLKVTGVESHNRYLTITGNVAAANKAFHTTIGRYDNDGQNVMAPSTDLAVPSSLGGAVLTVDGLDTTIHTNTPSSVGGSESPNFSAGFRNARPCSLYYGQVPASYEADHHTPLPKFRGETLSYAPCGYTGPQFRAAYEQNAPLDGSGVTVAITDAYQSKSIYGDASEYALRHGDGGYAPGQFSQAPWPGGNRGGHCGPSGWYGEETLDVEAVHAMAPGANIRYYASASCFDDDFLDTLARVVDENVVQLVSNSWGDIEQNETPDSIAAYESVFLQGASEGISFMYSSGDNGDELAAHGIRQADYPTSDPYVTSVGGTATGIGNGGQLLFQTGWGTHKFVPDGHPGNWTSQGYLYGAGGGTSALFNQPEYQQGIAPAGGRQVPDVALDADPTTGMLVGQTQTFSDGSYYDEYRIGGTSLASPLFAGMTALTLQAGGGDGIGLANPTIYASRNSAFTDVKGTPPTAGAVRVDYANRENASDGLLYSVRTFNQDSSLMLQTGWDDITGVGVPNTGWITALTN